MKLGGIEIATPVMNAACSVAKTLSDVKALSKTRAGLVLIGSITLKPRTINPGPNLQIEDYYALNSFGMPNKGITFYRRHLPAMLAVIHSANKKAVLSIAGFSLKDYVELAIMAQETKVDFIELNFGCPNVKDTQTHPEMISFNPILTSKIIRAVQKVCTKPLLIKVSPYSNPSQLQDVADVLREAKVAAVVTSNTFANGIFSSKQASKEHAGISGRALMPVALGQVYQFRQLLPKSIVVIGVGGIETRQDVETYIQVGAEIVQAATLIVRDGINALDRLTD